VQKFKKFRNLRQKFFHLLHICNISYVLRSTWWTFEPFCKYILGGDRFLRDRFWSLKLWKIVGYLAFQNCSGTESKKRYWLKFDILPLRYLWKFQLNLIYRLGRDRFAVWKMSPCYDTVPIGVMVKNNL
jgi:hypothetical protein